MRRKMLKALSLMLGTMVSTSAQAQDHDDVACEYGVMPYEPIMEPEPVPLYGIEEPVYLPEPAPLVVSGRVLKTGTDQPIEGIRLSMGEQTVLSDPDGRFAFSTVAPVGSATWDLLAEDIDGKDHGGKHRPTKLAVAIVDGALTPVIAEQGLTVELEPR